MSNMMSFKMANNLSAVRYIALNTQFVTSLFVTQNKCHFVIYKSFEKLSLNNFQVIIFERMAKNGFKVNIL